MMQINMNYSRLKGEKKMTDNAKILTVTCAAGAAFAVAPTVYGVIKNSLPKPITDADRIRIENGRFITEGGKPAILHGMNLNDELFFCKRNSDIVNETVDEIYSAFEKRFGAYGARTLINEYNNAFITEADLKHIRKLGANCVRIPLRWYLIFRKPDCKGRPMLERIEELIEKCRKLGLYVILDLHSAPEGIFEDGKEGFEARNAVVRIWSQLAVKYKNDPVIAAFDILNRPLNKVADAEGKLDILHKLYMRVFKAVRNIDESRILIMEASGYADSLPQSGKYKDSGVAFGLYSHFHTTFETEAMLRSIKNGEKNGIPFVICKIRSDDNWNYSLGKLCDIGVSWLAGDYKGTAGMSRLYKGETEYADLDNESYDELTKKWKTAPLTKNYTEGRDLAKTLKNYFAFGATEEKEKTVKPELKVKFGMNVIRGVKK